MLVNSLGMFLNRLVWTFDETHLPISARPAELVAVSFAICRSAAVN
jgi:hypothetical protein